MPIRRLLVAAVIVTALTASACTSLSSASPRASRPTPAAAAGATGASSAAGVGESSGGSSSSVAPTTPTAWATSPTASSPPIDPAVTRATAKRVHADELGRVPVLMYHQIVANPGGDRYNETPAAFRTELATLYRDGFRPVTAAQFVAGRFDVPAGRHPVVLTFDDATNSQFALGPDGRPAPDTAVGILDAFAAAHPDFPARATFFVNNVPFPQTPHALQWLHARGFEIAAHTVSHANLGLLTDAAAQREIGGNFQMIARTVGEAPTTFALPYGVYPKNRALSMRGTFAGRPYSMAGVFLVGSDPSRSPFAKGFDPANIHRIRSQHLPGADAPFESTAELADLAAHPDRLFTSDGDPGVVSYPASMAAYAGPLPAGLTADAY